MTPSVRLAIPAALLAGGIGYFAYLTALEYERAGPLFARDLLVGVSAWLIYFCMLSMGRLLFSRGHTGESALYAAAAALFLSAFDGLVSGAHQTFDEIGLYSLLGIRRSGNEQWATLVVYLSLFLALCVRTALSRSFDRVAFVVVAASVLLTGVLFHYQTVVSLRGFNAAETRLIEAYADQRLLDGERCAAFAIECHGFATASAVPPLKDGLSQVVESMRPYVFQHPDYPFRHSWTGVSSETSDVFVAVVVREVGADSATLVLSTQRPTERMRFEELRLAVSSDLAHAVWLFGGYFVCLLHSRRRRAWRLMRSVEPRITSNP